MATIYLQLRLNDITVRGYEREDDNNINLAEKGVDVFANLKISGIGLFKIKLFIYFFFRAFCSFKKI